MRSPTHSPNLKKPTYGSILRGELRIMSLITCFILEMLPTWTWVTMERIRMIPIRYVNGSWRQRLKSYGNSRSQFYWKLLDLKFEEHGRTIPLHVRLPIYLI